MIQFSYFKILKLEVQFLSSLMKKFKNSSVFIPFTEIIKRMVGCHIGILNPFSFFYLAYPRSQLVIEIKIWPYP